MEEKNIPEEKKASGIEKETVKPEEKGSAAKETAQPASEDTVRAKKAYRTGKIINDIGMGLFSVFILLGAVRFFLNMELYIGGSIVTSYLYFLLLIPCIMMITGLVMTNKAAKQLGKTEKGGKPMLIAIIIAAVLILGFSVAEIFHPSYHVYEIEKCKASDGREFMLAKSERVSITGEVHSEIPSYYDLDVYDVNGIFARKLCTKDVHKGSYNIEKTEKGYRLNISYLGIEEGIPFSV